MGPKTRGTAGPSVGPTYGPVGGPFRRSEGDSPRRRRHLLSNEEQALTATAQAEKFGERPAVLADRFDDNPGKGAGGGAPPNPGPTPAGGA
jgi:hypothetical protein